MTIEVLILLWIKRKRNYRILADALEHTISPNIAPLDKIEILSIGDQPPPKTPTVA
jgi:hypothetical protein